MIGLIDAVNKYDISKGVKFETYASIRIKGEIIDYLRKKDWIPRSLKKKYKKIEIAIEILQRKYKRDPSIEEIIDVSGLPKNDILKTLTYINAGIISSLEEAIENNIKINSLTNNDLVNPEDEIIAQDLKKRLQRQLMNYKTKKNW